MANIFVEPIFLDVAFKGTYLATIGTYLGTRIHITDILSDTEEVSVYLSVSMGAKANVCKLCVFLKERKGLCEEVC